MADPQRTHKPSAKRVREFRKRGDIALSRDAVSAAALFGGAIALTACASSSFDAIRDFVAHAMATADGRDSGDLQDLPRAALHAFLVATVPILLGAGLGAVFGIFGQLGWPPVWKGVHFDLGKLSPGKNLPQTYGLASMTRRTATALAKIVLVGTIVAFAISGDFLAHPIQAREIGSLVSGILGRVLIAVVAVLVTLGLGDYLLARRRIGGQMKMTIEELKREGRESDGDPMVKGKRRQRMRELAKRRMATAVATADVIVVNPTHYSVALRYTENVDAAPVVVAKGVDEAAAKIREIARKHGVPILSRPPLARALHKAVKEGRPVPANLYKAVAEVLAYVYRLKAR
ncbi:MAG: EscU/YscU/HrcU family type III secretion system export apparatus switch protein [Proteobacteria bacterium]|nr:EscU/YscU/HrcU family type III secretion system export apparatus switch protein [Pseudomonadota bacterium]